MQHFKLEIILKIFDTFLLTPKVLRDRVDLKPNNNIISAYFAMHFNFFL